MSALHVLWDVATTTGTWLVSVVGGALARAAVEGGVLLLAVGLVTRVLTRIPAPARTALWWLACGKLLFALAPHAPLAIAPSGSPIAEPTQWASARLAPWMNSNVVAAEPSVQPSDQQSECERSCKEKEKTACTGSGDSGSNDANGGTPTLDRNQDSGTRTAVFAGIPALPVSALLSIPLPNAPGTTYPLNLRAAWEAWIAMALLLWAAGMLIFAARLVRERRNLDAVWRGATPLTDPMLLALAGEWLPKRRILRNVEVRVSDHAAVPMTLGWWRPRVLLPQSSLADGRSARLALAHELVHVRRHDLLLGWVPAVGQMLFWFHPLVAWGVREYVQAREEACDAEALRLTGAAPREYGELLLRYGVVDDIASAAVASIGSRTARALHRRLDMLAHLARPTFLQRAAAGAAVVIALAAMLPLRVVARPSAPTEPEPIAAAQVADHEKTEKADKSEWKTKDKEKYKEAKRAEELAKVAQDKAEVQPPDDADNNNDSDSSDDDFGYMIVTRGSESTRGDVNTHDFEVLKRARARFDQDFELMRLDGESYVITDPDFRRDVLRMLAPTDSYDRMREAFEKRREEFSQRAEELDQAAQSAQEMAEKFGEEVDKVSEQIDAAIEKGKPTEALQARRNELLNKKDLARVAAHKAGVLREELTKQSDAQSVEGDRMWAEAEKVHSEIKLQLAELTRDAINRGIATKVK